MYTDYAMVGTNGQSGPECFIYATASRSAVGVTAPYAIRYMELFPQGVKQPGCEALQSHPYNAEGLESLELWLH
jgi:hypothetical protein